MCSGINVSKIRKKKVLIDILIGIFIIFCIDTSS